MQMTLLIITDGKKTYFTSVHSNWHFLKIIKNVVDYFRYDFIGCDVGRKNTITLKQLKEKIDKLVQPYEIYNWKIYKSFKDLELNKRCDDGYIIMNINNDKWGYNDICMDLQTGELSNDFEEKMFIERLKYRLKNLKI